MALAVPKRFFQILACLQASFGALCMIKNVPNIIVGVWGVCLERFARFWHLRGRFFASVETVWSHFLRFRCEISIFTFFCIFSVVWASMALILGKHTANMSQIHVVLQPWWENSNFEFKNSKITASNGWSWHWQCQQHENGDFESTVPRTKNPRALSTPELGSKKLFLVLREGEIEYFLWKSDFPPLEGVCDCFFPKSQRTWKIRF